MPKINLQGTEFEFSVLPLRTFADKYVARTKIAVKNEFIDYENISESITRDELQKWIFSAFRLLAGAYEKPRTLEFERANLSVDFVPFTPVGAEVTRETLRANDCITSVRLVMVSQNQKTTLGGVYSLLLHRKELEIFAKELQEEFDTVFKKYLKGKGKYSFVGVSPFGFTGCNYWYLDETNSVQDGDYVWLKMGRRKIEQIAYVDSVRRADENDAPYPLAQVKKIIRKATNEEVEEWKTEWQK